jgi:uroporphyrinogen decarboxylase
MGIDTPPFENGDEYNAYIVKGFFAAGYDYAPIRPFDAPIYTRAQRQRAETISLNDGALITDEKSFESFSWNNPSNCPINRLEMLENLLPEGGKLAVIGPGGIVENLIDLVGFDKLCYMFYDNPELVGRICDEIGKRIITYYEMAVNHDGVGMLIANDDWGFKTQSFLPEEYMRKYVFPWNKKITDLAHKHNKPILLHSCGFFTDSLMDAVANEMGYDGKHSFEDTITPVEKAYDKWNDSISIFGGIDVNFLCTESDEAITRRCRAMLEKAETYGGYALGSGNSIPRYIPLHAYQSMMSVMLG